MSDVLVIIHVLVCFFLVAVVLLQRGRGAEIGAVFGGGASSTVFGSRGAGNFLTKLTTAAAVIFMLTSFTLSLPWLQSSDERLFEGTLPAEEAAAAAENLFEEIETVPADPAPVAPEPAVEGSLPPLTAPLEAEQAP